MRVEHLLRAGLADLGALRLSIDALVQCAVGFVEANDTQIIIGARRTDGGGLTGFPWLIDGTCSAWTLHLGVIHQGSSVGVGGHGIVERFDRDGGRRGLVLNEALLGARRLAVAEGRMRRGHSRSWGRWDRVTGRALVVDIIEGLVLVRAPSDRVREMGFAAVGKSEALQGA